MGVKFDPLLGELVSDHGYGDRISAGENKNVRAEFYEEIGVGEGVSGTFSLPTGATLLVDSWQDSYEGVVTTVSTGQLPDQEFARTSGGAIITVDYLDNGDGTADYSLSGTPSAYPVALVYEYSVAWIDYVISSDLNNLISITVDGGTVGGSTTIEDEVGFGVLSSNPITAGFKGYDVVPFDCNIIGWSLNTDPDTAGNITVNVKKDMNSGTDVVGLGTKPVLSSATSNSGTAVDWDLSALTKGDILMFSVEGVPTITNVVFTLDVAST